MDLGNQQSSDHIQFLVFSHVTLGKLLKFNKPVSSPMKWGVRNVGNLHVTCVVEASALR